MAALISVIVATYNREDALEAVIRSLARQTDQDSEVVVADDGSAAATGQLAEAWKAKVGHRLEHVWHEDRGFRLAEIRNRAILAARGDYCIFLDGREGFLLAVAIAEGSYYRYMKAWLQGRGRD